MSVLIKTIQNEPKHRAMKTEQEIKDRIKKLEESTNPLFGSYNIIQIQIRALKWVLSTEQ